MDINYVLAIIAYILYRHTMKLEKWHKYTIYIPQIYHIYIYHKYTTNIPYIYIMWVYTNTGSVIAVKIISANKTI